MRLEDIYFMAKGLKENKSLFRPDTEIIIYLKEDEHSKLQEDIIKSSNGDINNITYYNIFELMFFDIKFIFKLGK